MGAAIPKQFMRVGPHSVLCHTVSVFLENPRIQGVILVLGADVDPDVLDLPPDSGRLFQVLGGEERSDSVCNGLEFLAARHDPRDWVLVHDAARPCLPPDDLERLLTELEHDPVGGLLALPSTDTLKRVDPQTGQVQETLDRSVIWRAQTPQMFRLGLLLDALRVSARSGCKVTDEAAAMEGAGFSPRLVEGSAVNIKITRPEDLALAEIYLGQRGRLGERL